MKQTWRRLRMVMALALLGSSVRAAEIAVLAEPVAPAAVPAAFAAPAMLAPGTSPFSTPPSAPAAPAALAAPAVFAAAPSAVGAAAAEEAAPPSAAAVPAAVPSSAADPKIAAFLDRVPRAAARLNAGGDPALAALRAALAAFPTADDVRGASAARLQRAARALFDGRRTNATATFWVDPDFDDEGGPGPAPGSAAPTTARKTAARGGYLRSSIAEARFGAADRAPLLREAYGLAERIGRKVVGQTEAATALQNRLVSYLESQGTRKREPMALHLAGLTGVGKSAMIDELEKTGIAVLRFDAQNYIEGKKSFGEDVREAVSEFQKKSKGKPFVLAIEELDKMAEIADGEEKTNAFVGTLNQILADGKAFDPAHPYKTADLSNALVVTTMNFSPKEIQAFAKEVLKEDKSYYDFTDEDFAAFDSWMRAKSASRSKVLSQIFRSNTVGRLAPNLVIMNALGRATYRQIAARMIEAAIARTQTGAPVEKHLKVAYTPAYADFVAERTAFAPSGARETVSRSDMLTEQLIQYGARATAPGDKSLDRPRSLLIDMAPGEDRARLTVTPRLMTGRTWHDGKPFEIEVEFDPILGEFRQPGADHLALDAPARKEAAATPKPAKILKKDVLAARFPKLVTRAKGLAKAVGKKLFGQDEAAQLIEREMTAYLGRPGPAVKEPTTLVFAGFPGIGKSAIVEESAKYVDLPVIRINMESYASDESDAVKNFLDEIDNQLGNIAEERGPNWDGKYVLLLEELDKVSEIEKGNRVQRPVMSVVKDILNNGQASHSTFEPETGPFSRDIDVRAAFVFVTMNFPIDAFGFKADPRWTSIKDTVEAWKKLKTRLTDMKELLSSMFRDETVNRLLTSLRILGPLQKADYEKLVEYQLDNFVKERLVDESGLNAAQITVKLTAAYRRYLFAETVVPSEGGRHTAKMSRGKIGADTEEAIRRLKRSAPYASEPVTVVLDYYPVRTQVVAKLYGKGADGEILYKRKTVLFFPPLAARGRMTKTRVLTAVHEFGHAYAGVRLGLRLDYATVIPPTGGVGGYVKFKDENDSARNAMAHVYSAVASRALERMFLSADPTAKESVMDITQGPSMDIKMATVELFEMVHKLGFNPNGGTMDRTGGLGPEKYANFGDIPPDAAEKLGLVLRDMEDYVVEDLTKAHPREWYVEKITEFARRGGVDEKEFYKLIGYRHPGPKLEKETVSDRSRVADTFAAVLKPEPAAMRAARAYRQGLTATTAGENLDAYAARFLQSLRERLGPPSPPPNAAR
jgi:ATP-dependent Clp protease ATP-binding subunit ClpA